jgi:hypothetical protein
VIPVVLASSFHWSDDREVFWICAAGFAVVGVAIFFVDATERLPDPGAAPLRSEPTMPTTV